MNSQTKPSSAGPIKKQSAPIDPEFRRLQLEIEIKKKEAEKKLKAAEERKRKEEERKQKAAEEKRKKEELEAQRKNPQSRGSIVSQNSKGAENKSSLSNIDDTETANKGGSRTLESLKPQSGGSFSGGSEGYLKEEVQVSNQEESMEARASRIKADILQANKGSRNNLDSKRDEEYDEDFEIKTPQKDAWELQKSIVEKAEKQRTEEVRRSVVQSKGLKEDVPSYNIAEPLQLGASKTGFRTQNLVGGDLNGNNNNNNNSRPVSASQNIEAGNSKGFQRRPLQTEEKAQNQGAGEYRGQKQNLEGNEINRLVREAGAIVDNNLKKVSQNGGREPIAEKTRQQLEIAMQAKKFMMEQQKAKKRNEEAAIEKKKQMLNQFYNKNTERRGPSISQAGEHVPEPAYYQDDNEDYSMTPQRSEQKKDRFEDEGSIRGSKIQGRNVPEPAYYHENDNEDYDVTPSKSEQRQDKFEASLRSSKMQGQNIPEPAYYHENDNEDYSMAPQRSEQKKDRFEDSIRGSKVQQRENIPDPAYYHENDNEDYSMTPQRSELKQDKFETSLRGSKVQGQNIPDPAYYHENDNEDYNMRSSKAQERQQDKLEASLRNSKMQGQNIPEPAYYHENDNEDYSATPSRSEQRQDKLEASLRNSKMQGKNIPEPAYYHENDNEDYETHPSRSEQKQKDTRQQGSRVPEPAYYHQDDNEDYETYPSRSEQKQQQYDSREPEDQDEHWEDGNEGEESDHRDPEEDEEQEEEDQYQQEEDQEDDQEEEEEQSNNQWGYNKGNHRQYQDDASGLVELDRRDYNAQYNAPSQKKSEPREETRQSIAQSNKKSDWGYNPFEDDEPKSVMSTPYKQEVRQIPQSSAAQNDWSYDNGQYDRSNNQSVRQSSQSNNNWNAKNKSQPEDDYEKPEEEPKFSYAQLHARNKRNTQEGLSSNGNEGSYQNQRHYEQQQQQQVSYGDHGRRNNQAEPQYSKPAYEEETDKNLATFGRKHFANNDSEGEEEEEEGYESRYSQQGGQKKHVAYEREDSEDEREQNQQWEEPAKYEPNFSQKRGGTGYSSMANQSVDRKGPISQDRYEPSRVSNTITTENENFNRIKENFNESNNKKSASVSMKPRGTSKWDMRRDVEGEDKSSEDRTPKQKGDEEYNTGNFGDKLPQIRSQWGGQEKSQSISTKSLKDLEPKTREETRIDDDEEEMLASYKNQANKEKKEEMGSGKSKKEVEIPVVVPKQQEKVLLVFDTEEDEVAKQRKQKKLLEMNKRMQERKVQMEEKKERDRSFVGERGATPGPANVSDNEEVETPIRKPVKKVSERPVEKLPEINPVKPKIPRVPSANVKKAIFEREREPLEELHSVGPSAKSNKSAITKSPGGPNNIFQKERTPTGFGGKKGVVEFSTKSNKLLIKNAMGVCLAGEPNRKEREEVITKLNEVKDDVNFIIVFKPIPGRQDFKALYAYDTATDEIRKVHAIGNAPVLLDPSIVENYYRYNSGGKEFKVIQGNKNFSRAVDAVSLHPYLFKKVNADKLY